MQATGRLDFCCASPRIQEAITPRRLELATLLCCTAVYVHNCSAECTGTLLVVLNDFIHNTAVPVTHQTAVRGTRYEVDTSTAVNTDTCMILINSIYLQQ